MRCKCGSEHNGIYGSRCENCWADAQDKTTGPHGMPYLSGLGERRSRTTSPPSDPDFFALVNGGIVAVL